MVPVPFVEPDVLPAKVVTTPAGVILRIRSLPISDTYRLPSKSKLSPYGELNVALVPVPSVEPDVLPAKVVTTPSGVIIRIRLLSVSATYTFPTESHTRP